MYLFSKQKLYKYLLGLIIGILTFCVGGNNKVHAALLKVERIPNIYVATWGGDKEPLFGQYGIFEINGKVVYCVEPGVEIITDNYNGDAGWGNSPYNDTINDRIQLIGYYGYNYPGHGTLRYRMATQALIWEATRGQSVEFWTQPFGNGDFINIDFERTEIMKLVNMHYTKPSFDR